MKEIAFLTGIGLMFYYGVVMTVKGFFTRADHQLALSRAQKIIGFVSLLASVILFEVVT